MLTCFVELPPAPPLACRAAYLSSPNTMAQLTPALPSTHCYQAFRPACLNSGSPAICVPSLLLARPLHKCAVCHNQQSVFRGRYGGRQRNYASSHSFPPGIQQQHSDNSGSLPIREEAPTFQEQQAEPLQDQQTKKTGFPWALVVMVLAFGVSNRVLYRMALVPMQEYVFFLAQFQNLGYLMVYFSSLYLRYRAGKVTQQMLRINKLPFIAIGACEAMAQLLFMIGASHVPGLLIPVVGQTYLAWNLAFASSMLGARFSKSQIGGVLLVMAGVALCAVPSHLLYGGAADLHIPPLYLGLCLLCFAFSAMANIFKELLFNSAKKQLNGQQLDVFVVNSFGSLAQELDTVPVLQAAFVLLLLPVTTFLNHIALPELPSYLQQGCQCFLGQAPAGSGSCQGAPLLPFLYVTANLVFNISMLTLLRTVGSVKTTIIGSCLVPLTIFAFTLPLPYLETAVLSLNFIQGSALLMVGLLVYNYSNLRNMLPLQQAPDAELPQQ